MQGASLWGEPEQWQLCESMNLGEFYGTCIMHVLHTN